MRSAWAFHHGGKAAQVNSAPGDFDMLEADSEADKLSPIERHAILNLLKLELF
jgi:hypothetical protein